MSSNMEYPAPTTIRAHEAWQAHIGIRGFAEMGSYFVFRPWADRLGCCYAERAKTNGTLPFRTCSEKASNLTYDLNLAALISLDSPCTLLPLSSIT